METIAEMNTSSDSEDQAELCEYTKVAYATTSESTRPPILRSKRFVVGILLFFGYIVNSMAYQVVNIAVVEMTLDSGESLPTEFGKIIAQVNPIFNMYWYGFMFSAIGGHLAQKFGGSVVLGASTLLSGIFTMATSLNTYHGFHYFLACRGFVGLFQGFSSASYSAVFASWVPKEERLTLMYNAVNGMFIGDAVAYLFYACLTRYWGWSVVFQTIGALSITWAVLWLILVRNTPSDDLTISKSELDYILQGTGGPLPKNSDQLYRKILKSSSFWALSICQFATCWVRAIIQVYFPFICNDLYGTHVSLNVLLLVNLITVPIIVDWTMFFLCDTSTEIFLCKLGISLGFFVPAVMFAIIGTLPLLTDDPYIFFSLSCFNIIKLLLSYNEIKLEIITINMAPNHAALLSGLTSFWQAIGVITIQTIVGLEADGEHLFGWVDCLLLTAAVLDVTDNVYILFGSTDPQPWSVSSSSEKDE